MFNVNFLLKLLKRIFQNEMALSHDREEIILSVNWALTVVSSFIVGLLLMYYFTVDQLIAYLVLTIFLSIAVYSLVIRPKIIRPWALRMNFERIFNFAPPALKSITKEVEIIALQPKVDSVIIYLHTIFNDVIKQQEIARAEIKNFFQKKTPEQMKEIISNKSYSKEMGDFAVNFSNLLSSINKGVCDHKTNFQEALALARYFGFQTSARRS